jgi:DNA-binding beta-propeller fold protein YncE
MLTIVTALALLAQTSSTVGQQPAFVVGEKVAGSVGFYDAQFKRLRSVKVGVHPHEMWLSADKRTLYVADNGVLWMTETGRGENTISVIDVPSQRRTRSMSSPSRNGRSRVCTTHRKALGPTQ